MFNVTLVCNRFTSTNNPTGIGIIIFYELMPAGVHIPQWIIADIAVPVQALRVARVGDDGVGLDEAGERGVVAPGDVKVQAKGKSK